MEDVEELGAEEMVPLDDNPLSALIDEPAKRAPVAMNNGKIAALEQRVRQLEGSLKDILKTLGDLSTRVKNQIGP
jgi:polyhydroxyalkanoate synthesis regulator phasin